MSLTISRVLHDTFVHSVFSSETVGAKGLMLSPLTGVSYLYRAVMIIRCHAYRHGFFPSRKLGIPVISIGNLTVGGTGKTPAAIMVARALQKEGTRVAVLSRGYKGAARNPVNVVSDGRNILLTPDGAGDEPFLLAEQLPGVPIVTGKDRRRVGEYAQQTFAAEVAILDDGFQHLALQRDVDIVMLDGKRPFGNGFLLPRGALREPPSVLRRAHIAIVTLPSGPPDKARRLAVETFLRGCHADLPIFYAWYTPLRLASLDRKEHFPDDYLQGKNVVALAGIGRPDSFSALLTRLGARVVESRFFPDHHRYRPEDISPASGAAIIVTTAKDAVKLRPLGTSSPPVIVLSVKLHLEEEQGFLACLKKYLPCRS